MAKQTAALSLAQQGRPGAGETARSGSHFSRLALAGASHPGRSVTLRALALRKATCVGQAELERLKARARVEVLDAAEAYDQERNEFRFYKGIDESGFPEEEEPLKYVRSDELNVEAAADYIVVHERVAIRKQPKSTARVLDVLKRGDVVQVFGFDETGTWSKIRLTLRGGIGGTVEAWVMIWHSDLGMLLEPAGLDQFLMAPEPRAVEPPSAEEDMLVGTATDGEQAAPQSKEPAAQGGEASTAQEAEVVTVGREPAAPPRSSRGSVPAGQGADVAAGGPVDPRRTARGGRQGEAAAAPSQPKGPRRRVPAGRHLETIVKNHAWLILSQQDLLYCISEMGLTAKEPSVTVTTEDGTQIACCSDMTSLIGAGRRQYQVVRRPVVIARSAPFTSATMLSAVPVGTVVDTYGEDASGKWVRVLGHFGLTQYFGIAWMLTEHTEFGTLLVRMQ